MLLEANGIQKGYGIQGLFRIEKLEIAELTARLQHLHKGEQSEVFREQLEKLMKEYYKNP